MPFTLIQGTFHVVGRAPDGDTLGFRAKDFANWEKLEGPRPRFNMNGNGDITSLRFESIDTLETHYVPGMGKTIHQPQPYANNATDFTLQQVGIKNVVWGERDGERTRVTSADDGVNGYMLARAVEKNGRPVSFVFCGTTKLKDGSSQFLDVKWLKESINYQLVADGMAYPTYYDDMCRFVDLRDAITEAVKTAKKAKKGIWKKDKSSGLTVSGEKQLIEDDVILPKLFRRLTEYLRTNGDDVRGFKAWLKMQAESILVLSPDMMGMMGTFDQVIFEEGKKVGLLVDPYQIIFKP